MQTHGSEETFLHGFARRDEEEAGQWKNGRGRATDVSGEVC